MDPMSIQYVRHIWPFPYVTATEVFPPQEYLAVAEAIQAKLEVGHFTKNMPGYDASGLGWSARMAEPLQQFAMPAWRDWLCGLFKITPTPYMSVGAHHHDVNSASGFIHNDYNPVWFPLTTRPIQLSDHARCSYKFGDGPLAPH